MVFPYGEFNADENKAVMGRLTKSLQMVYCIKVGLLDHVIFKMELLSTESFFKKKDVSSAEQLACC